MKSVQDTLSNLTTFLNSYDPSKMDYEKTINELKVFTQECTGLTPNTNPIIGQLKEMTEKELKFFIGEYSQISHAAIHMLLEARIRNYKWKGLRSEIDRNIEEEKGLLTGSVPHLEMMREGYLSDFGIETDSIHASPSTHGLVSRLTKIFRNNDNAFNSGALLAFESISCDEFDILDSVVGEWSNKSGKKVYEGNTRNYINGHKMFEIGHENGLKIAIMPYIDKTNVVNFIKGYAAILVAMSTWWENISNDIKTNRLTKN